MRVEHPLWRGFFLAVMLTASRVLLGAADGLPIKARLVLAGGLLLGAALASFPGFLRRRRETPKKTTWQRCVLCLVCGMVMGISLRLAGGWGVLLCLMEGSVGALTFVGVALLAGCITARIARKKEAA